MTQKTKVQSLVIWKDGKTGGWDCTALQYRIHICEKDKEIAGEKWLDSVSQHLRGQEYKLKKGCTQKDLAEFFKGKRKKKTRLANKWNNIN